MKQVWIAAVSLVLALVALLGAGALGSLGLAVLAGLWAVSSAFWLIMASFLAYADGLAKKIR